jgi:hypothetical protein
MRPTFISYSGERLDRGLLVDTLREHGVVPWRDVEDLLPAVPTTEAIEAVLTTCSATILWINDVILRSEFVRIVELPAIARAWRKGGLRILPVFDGLSPEKASSALAQWGIEVGDQNGYVIDPGTPQEAIAATIARRLLRTAVADAHSAGLDPVVRLVTYDDTAALKEEAVVNLDWRHCVSGDGRAVHEKRLVEALAAAAEVVKQTYGATEITLAVKAHLPFAVALGHAFSEPTGCTLRMPRDGVDYCVRRGEGIGLPLRAENGMRGPVEAMAASVEVSVTRDIEAGVNAYAAAGTRYRERVMLRPAGVGRSALDDPGLVGAWSRQIGEILVALRDTPGIDRIDLFVSAPVELAIAIGWHANALGPIELMNWSGKQGPYVRAWTLQ